MRLRRSARMEDRRRSLMSGLEQGRETQVAEGSKLKLQQENREGGEISKVLAGVGSPPSIAMPGELHGGSRESGASPSHMDYSEIPPSPQPQAPVKGPDRAAVGISNAAEVAVPAIDSVKSKQTHSPPEDCVDDRNLLTRPKGKNSAEGRITDSHDPDGYSKNLDLVAPAPTGSHNEDEHGSRSQLQMPRAKGRSGHSALIPWIGLSCPSCKSTNFSICTDANAESVVNRMHYQCNNCKQTLCKKYVRSYKDSGSEFKVGDRAKKGASQLTRRGIGLYRTIQAMRNLKPSQLAAPNSNAKAMPPPSNPNMKLMPPPSNPNMKLMPPPSYTRIPNVRLPDIQDARRAKTTLPPRSSSCSDKLEDDHPSRESNLQLDVAHEPQARFPMKLLEAMGPFPLSANLQESPSNQSVKGKEKEPSFANDGFSVKGIRDSIRGYRSSPLEDSGGGTVSDGGRPSNGLPCPSCKSTNTRFSLVPNHHFCNNCREYWIPSHLQHHEVQLPSKQFSKGVHALMPILRVHVNSGPRSLPLQVHEDGDGVSNQGPLNAPSCSRCKSTFTRLCTYGVFCDACGKHSPFAGTRDPEVPANPPVALVHEVFDTDSPSREHQMQSLPPPGRPIMVDASTQTDPVAMVDASIETDPLVVVPVDTQTDPVAMVPLDTQTDRVAMVPAQVPVDDRRGKHIVHGFLHTHNYEQVDIDERKKQERKRRRGN